jgi:hypothetical protein
MPTILTVIIKSSCKVWSYHGYSSSTLKMEAMFLPNLGNHLQVHKESHPVRPKSTLCLAISDKFYAIERVANTPINTRFSFRHSRCQLHSFLRNTNVTVFYVTECYELSCFVSRGIAGVTEKNTKYLNNARFCSKTWSRKLSYTQHE